MPYSFDDMLQTLSKDGNGSEEFGHEIAKVSVMDTATAELMFPGVEIAKKNVWYFPFNLCNSYPAVNKRKRLFTNPVLLRSFRTVTDQLVNLEHQLDDNFPGTGQDEIIGCVKTAKFDLPLEEKLRHEGELAYMPTKSYPVVGLGAIFDRSKKAKEIVTSYLDGTKNWGVSMECNHRWEEACFLYEGKFIPVKESDSKMLECLRSDTCLPFMGKELAVALGGLHGSVDFWGLGMTTSPADRNSKVLGFAVGKNKELASSKKIFYAPMRMFSDVACEIASTAATVLMTELASIGPIGETQPDGDDGHSHIVLSDCTIMPQNGHSHGMRSMAISRGTKPTLTGVTTEHNHSTENNGRYQQHTHLHAVNIPLNGKYKASGKTDHSSTELPPTETASYEGVQEMARTLFEVTKNLTEVSAQMVAAKTDDDRQRIAREIASLNTEAAQLNSDESLKKLVDDRLADMVKTGQILTKEKANEAVAEAVKKEQDGQAEKDKITQAKAARLQKLKDAAINLSHEIPEIKDAAGKPMKISDIVDSLSIDEAGERSFIINMAAWKTQADLAKKEADAAAAKTQEDAAAGVQAAAAASAPTSIYLAAGGGPATNGGGTPTLDANGKEIASTADVKKVGVDGNGVGYDPNHARIVKGKGVFSI